MRLRLLHAVLVISLILSLAVPAAAAEEGRSGNIAMAAAAPSAKGKGYYDLQAKPGETVTLPFIVRNPSGQKVEATVYASDAATADGGGMRAHTPEEVNTATGTWLSPASVPLTLAPGESRTVTFTLRVPKDVQPGQHVASVVARVFEQGRDPGQPDKDQANFKFNVAHQVIIGVMVTIPGPVVQNLTATGVEHFYQGEQLWLRAVVRNDGTAIAKPLGRVRILDKNRREAFVTEFAMDSIYPGTEGGVLAPVTTGMDKSGQYTAEVELSAGGNKATAQSFPVVLSSQDVKAADEVRYEKIKQQRTDDVVVLPLNTLMIGGGALLLAVALGAGVFMLRRPKASRLGGD